ncbi:hypothetical protein F4859DRAFT_330946 [Xylaria cf. heliscus]|nr:hypothetical protein F4859DRAFT_330946 [Xylaria cf. heliscus]
MQRRAKTALRRDCPRLFPERLDTRDTSCQLNADVRRFGSRVVYFRAGYRGVVMPRRPAEKRELKSFKSGDPRQFCIWYLLVLLGITCVWLPTVSRARILPIRPICPTCLSECLSVCLPYRYSVQVIHTLYSLYTYLQILDGTVPDPSIWKKCSRALAGLLARNFTHTHTHIHTHTHAYARIHDCARRVCRL